jgi:hypothetical protein
MIFVFHLQILNTMIMPPSPTSLFISEEEEEEEYLEN